MYFKLLASGITAVVLSAGAAVAASFPTFVFDKGNSSIDVVGGDVCIPGTCTLDADFNPGTTGYSFTPTSVGEMDVIDDFIDWSVDLSGGGFFGPSGGGLYSVTATLAFSAPDMASGGATGSAGFVVLFGSLSAGFLTWDGGGTGTIDFADGSALGYDLGGLLTGGLGTSATSNVKFTAVAPSAVPLPASSLMLLAGVGGLVAMRRRKKKAA